MIKAVFLISRHLIAIVVGGGFKLVLLSREVTSLRQLIGFQKEIDARTQGIVCARNLWSKIFQSYSKSNLDCWSQIELQACLICNCYHKVLQPIKPRPGFSPCLWTSSLSPCCGSSLSPGHLYSNLKSCLSLQIRITASNPPLAWIFLGTFAPIFEAQATHLGLCWRPEQLPRTIPLACACIETARCIFASTY